MKYICLVYHLPNVLDSLTNSELAAHISANGGCVGELETRGQHGRAGH
ncbi:MAG: hypothetical protein ACLQVD_16250 [Capsulimonadaceae bacterium]